MKTRIDTVMHEDGTFQRFQVVSGFDWDSLRFFSPGIEPLAVKELVRLYQVVINPTLEVHMGSFVFFNVPEDIHLPFKRNTAEGYIYDDNILLKLILEDGFRKGTVRLDGEKLATSDPEIEKILCILEDRGLIGISFDEGDFLNFIPINEKMGFISHREGSLKVNCHFFLMDPTDMDSPYCKIETPHGLILEDGHVMNPPLNHRRLLLVDNEGRSRIARVELSDLTYEIDGVMYEPERNSRLHFRPDERVTPKHDGTDLVIVEEKVVAVKKGGNTIIPVAGFVLSVPGSLELGSTDVVYHGLEHFKFGAQVGPVVMDEGRAITSMCFPFFDFNSDEVIYAPTSYPLSFDHDRAARVLLGTDSEDRPLLIWAEGAGKLGIEKENDSTGASLLECADYCRSQGFKNVIHLDGGGSSQVILEGRRYLKIADRMPVTNAESERPIPNALYVL